jgi:AcrR family transcriptional regulator
VSVVTNSERSDETAPAARPGKRERLVSAASELVYRQGVARTTLADIAEAADVPLGNVYYYFKTKDDIVGAVLRTRTDEVESTLTDLDRRHRSPKARLKGLMGVLAERADTTALYGCPYGTLSTELAKRAEGPDPLVAPLMRTMLDWVEQQFRAMGRRDAPDLAVELIAAYEGSSILSNALAQPDLMARHTRRLQRWIETLDA